MQEDSLAKRTSRPIDSRGVSGFTLLEIAGVAVILAILASLGAPLLARYNARAEGLQCMANLKSLGLGVSAYVEDHKSWPQITTGRKSGMQSSPLSAEAQSNAAQWIEALAPYGISEKNWRCPTVEKQIKRQGQPEALKQKRIDYTPTQFDTRPESPRQWPKHPWFVERGSLHPTGPNILFADGSLSTFDQIANFKK